MKTRKNTKSCTFHITWASDASQEFICRQTIFPRGYPWTQTNKQKKQYVSAGAAASRPPAATGIPQAYT